MSRLREKISLERGLTKLAAFQCRHYKKVIVATLVLTVFLGYGATELRFQGDLEKEMPQDLPVFVLQDKIASEFRGEEYLVVAVCLDRETGAKDLPHDIRDPRVVASVVELHERLEAESSIEKVVSVAPLFQGEGGVPPDLEGVKKRLASASGSGAESFFNDDFSIMLVYVSPLAGLSEEKVRAVTEMIQNDVDAITKPAGVKYKITGVAPLIIELLRLMREDMKFTTAVAAAIIFGLLALLERSFSKGFLVFLPLIFGITWTFGTMGFLGIPISISTVMIGAVIIGLGVEYGIFMVSRYYEERWGKRGRGRKEGKERKEKKEGKERKEEKEEKERKEEKEEKERKEGKEGKEGKAGKSSREALRVAVTNIGASTFGSAATTIAAFLALTLSVMPMIQHLGQSLALGIFFCWIAAVLVNPCFIVFEERLEVEARELAGWLSGWLGAVRKRGGEEK
ncbi:MAG: MMPL family transporter [Methanophagales archaeon]|nr:MMPL family transporter [Methanophagales archaeon]